MDQSEREPPLIAPGGRSFKTSWPLELLRKVGVASFASLYRGIPIYKDALDLMLYMQLLERLKPNTVIEIGSMNGGSALWFADMISSAGRAPRIVSVDLQPPSAVVDSRINFITGDACDLGQVLTEAMLEELPRPWLVTEDSAHRYETTRAVLDFFDHRLHRGEYIVIEDGLVGEWTEEMYREYENGPNRAVCAFLEAAGRRYMIDPALCDFFGYNGTLFPNGWLRRN